MTIMRRLSSFVHGPIAWILMWTAIGMSIIGSIAALGGVHAIISLDRAIINPEAGQAYITHPIPRRIFVIASDDNTAFFQGDSQLMEDGQSLGPGRQLHQAIRDHGKGLFALNFGFLRFAASDGSDPRTNGRIYQLDAPVVPGLLFWLWITCGFGLGFTRYALCRGRDTQLSSQLSTKPVQRKIPAIVSTTIGMAAAIAALRSAGPLQLSIDSPALTALALFFVALTVVAFFLWRSILRDFRTKPARRRARKISWVLVTIGAALFLYGGFFSTGLVTVHRLVGNKDISAREGKMFDALLPQLPLGLAYNDFWRTRLTTPTHVFEDGVEIGLRDDIYQRIIEWGAGRFTISGGSVQFSSSDGSDPTINGRRYEIITPVLALYPVFLLGLFFASVGLWMRHQWKDAENPAKPFTLPCSRWDAVTMAAAYTTAIAAALLLWRGASVIGFRPSLAGVALWIAPFVVVISIVCSVANAGHVKSRGCFFPLALIFFCTFITTLTCLGPLLDNFLLADSFGSLHNDGSQILSMFHANDSATYIASAMHIAETGFIDNVAVNRPLNATILAWVFWGNAGDLPAMLFWRTAWVAACIAVAMLEIGKSFEWVCAFIFGIFVACFVSQFMPTALSEPNGVAFSCLGLGLTIRSLRSGSFGMFIGAVVMTTIAMMARPGALFSIPALILFAWTSRERFQVGHLQSLLYPIMAAIAAAFIPKYLNWALDAPSGEIFSNFPHTLYGLAMGGKGWSQIIIDHPDLHTPSEMYAVAIKQIASDPGLVIGFLVREFFNFWPFTYALSKIDFLYALSLCGFVIAITTLRNHYSRFLVFMLASIWVSSPIIMGDGGFRVFAASIPVFALASIWPLVWFRDNLQGIALTDQAEGSPAGSIAATSFFAIPGLVGWVAIIIFILVMTTPIMFGHEALSIMTRKVPSSCLSGETSVLVRGSRTAQAIHVVSDRGPQSIVPSVRESSFNRHLVLSAPEIATELGRIPAGSTVAEINVPQVSSKNGPAIHLVFFLGQDMIFPENHITEICASPIQAQFNHSLYVNRALRIVDIP